MSLTSSKDKLLIICAERQNQQKEQSSKHHHRMLSKGSKSEQYVLMALVFKLRKENQTIWFRVLHASGKTK